MPRAIHLLKNFLIIKLRNSSSVTLGHAGKQDVNQGVVFFSPCFGQPMGEPGLPMSVFLSLPALVVVSLDPVFLAACVLPPLASFVD